MKLPAACRSGLWGRERICADAARPQRISSGEPGSKGSAQTRQPCREPPTWMASWNSPAPSMAAVTSTSGLGSPSAGAGSGGKAAHTECPPSGWQLPCCMQKAASWLPCMLTSPCATCSAPAKPCRQPGHRPRKRTPAPRGAPQHHRLWRSLAVRCNARMAQALASLLRRQDTLAEAEHLCQAADHLLLVSRRQPGHLGRGLVVQQEDWEAQVCCLQVLPALVPHIARGCIRRPLRQGKGGQAVCARAAVALHQDAADAGCQGRALLQLAHRRAQQPLWQDQHAVVCAAGQQSADAGGVCRGSAWSVAPAESGHRCCAAACSKPLPQGVPVAQCCQAQSAGAPARSRGTLLTCSRGAVSGPGLAQPTVPLTFSRRTQPSPSRSCVAMLASNASMEVTAVPLHPVQRALSTLAGARRSSSVQRLLPTCGDEQHPGHGQRRACRPHLVISPHSRAWPGGLPTLLRQGADSRRHDCLCQAERGHAHA